VVEQVIEGKGGLEDGEAFIEIDEEMSLNFLERLFFQIDYFK